MIETGLSGDELGQIVVKPPGPRSRELSERLRAVENRDITFIGEGFPVFLNGGAGANLMDVDGNVYVDFTAAFGVAAVGHSNPRVVAAVAKQAERLLHGMGDVHPTPEKVELAELLCELTPGKGPKRVIFASSGSEAVESALKTAVIATGKPGVIAFGGAYHGLGYGSLAVTDRDHFRRPFLEQLNPFVERVPYAYCYRCPISLEYPRCGVQCVELVERALDSSAGARVGAIIVEPILGRGGEVPAPPDWLQRLRRICDERGLVLIFDEIFSGFGRTGRWFACEYAGVEPDVICVGKGMASGFPISATIGKAEVMDRWPLSSGEAIHTSTFLGHPTGCAAAIACIAEIRERNLVERAAELGARIERRLRDVKAHAGGRIGDVRGRGMMWGLECIDRTGEPDRARAAQTVVAALHRGVLLLTSGPSGNVVALTPTLVITEPQLDFGLDVLAESIAR